MVVEGVLSPSLTHPPAVNSRRDSAADEVFFRTIPDKVEPVNEFFEVLDCTQHLGVIRRVAGGIRDRIPSIQVVKTSASSDDELPRFHTRVCNSVTLVPNRIPVRFVKIDGFIMAVLELEGLHSSHLKSCLPYVL